MQNTLPIENNIWRWEPAAGFQRTPPRVRNVGLARHVLMRRAIKKRAARAGAFLAGSPLIYDEDGKMNR
jgi:hypothetical protein